MVYNTRNKGIYVAGTYFDQLKGKPIILNNQLQTAKEKNQMKEKNSRVRRFHKRNEFQFGQKYAGSPQKYTNQGFSD